MDNRLFRYLTAKGLVSWEKIASNILSESSRVYRYSSDDLASIEIERNLLQNFHREYDFFSTKNPLIGHVSSSIEDISLVQKLLIDAYEVFQDPFILEQVTGEILAKVLAYRNLKKGMTIYIPWVIGTKTDLIPCTVDRVFNLWQSMLAFGIQPKDKRLPVLILFRGTDLSLINKSSRISIISNFDPKGPGYSVFLHSKKRLKTWLEENTNKSRKAKLIGYSLGGALATYLLYHEPAYFSENSSSLLFHQPGLIEENLIQFERTQKEYGFAVRAFIADGDPVSKYGYLFCDTIGLKTKTKILRPFQAHTQLFCALEEFEAKKVDVREENQSESRRFYSGLHQKTTNILYKLGISHFLP